MASLIKQEVNSNSIRILDNGKWFTVKKPLIFPRNVDVVPGNYIQKHTKWNGNEEVILGYYFNNYPAMDSVQRFLCSSKALIVNKHRVTDLNNWGGCTHLTVCGLNNRYGKDIIK